MEIKPLRTDEDIEDFIRKHYGSVDNYLARRNDKPPLPTPKPQVVHKTDAQIFLDLCDAMAKNLGMNRQEFFTKYHEQYGKYNKLVTGDY